MLAKLQPPSDQPVIRIMCPKLSCQRVLAVPANARGKLVRCKSCGTNIRIPEAKAAPTAEKPAAGAAPPTPPAPAPPAAT